MTGCVKGQDGGDWRIRYKYRLDQKDDLILWVAHQGEAEDGADSTFSRPCWWILSWSIWCWSELRSIFSNLLSRGVPAGRGKVVSGLGETAMYLRRCLLEEG